jgi:L-threonylcarbamoyladenylate synthase
MPLISVADAVEHLRRGQVVALPTETVYGLAGRIDDDKALREIFAVKKRPYFDPLIVHVPTLEVARSLSSNWPALYDQLCSVFWPGPLTVIAPKAARVSELITSGLDSVAIRCPQHPLMLQILRELGVPLAAPSANRFGHTSPTSAGHVLTEFNDQVAVVDGGPCVIGVESTVLSAEQKDGRWQIRILRPGGVSREQLRQVLNRLKVDYELSRAESSASPGHLPAHYQPDAPVILIENGGLTAEHKQQIAERLGRTVSEWLELRLPETPQQSARELYAEFRRLSQDPSKAIWVQRLTSQRGEEWEAVWDRIERAASLKI